MIKSPILAVPLCSLILGVLTLSGASARSPVFATGTYDGFGYSWIDSEEPGGPVVAFEDISLTSATPGTSLFPAVWDNNVSAALTLGFTFPFYGTNYTTCYVCSNGYVGFGTTVNTTASPGIPSTATPNPLIAVFMGNLHSGAGAGQVLYRAFTGAGNDHFVVQWLNVSHQGAQATSRYTFQVRFYASGRVVYNYKDMTGTFADGSNTTQGIENQTGTIGQLYQANGTPATNAIHTDLAVQFNPNADPTVPTGSTQAATAGGTAEPANFISDASVFLRATVGDPNVGQTVRLQAEILPVATPFDPVATTGQVVISPLVAIGTVAEATYTFTGVPYGNGTYHWRCRTMDQYNRTSGWATPAVDLFQVDIVAPGLGTLLSPPNGMDVDVSAGDGGSVTFTWAPPPDAGPAALDSYDVQIARDNGFGNILTTATVTSPSLTAYVPTSHLPYYWRIRTRDAVGNQGMYGTSFSFRSVHDNHYNNSAGDSAKVCGSGATPSTGGTWALIGFLVIALGMIVRR